MPTVLRSGTDRFFYAGDGGEPPHVHVERDDSEAKSWLDPVRLERSHAEVAGGMLRSYRARLPECRRVNSCCDSLILSVDLERPELFEAALPFTRSQKSAIDARLHCHRQRRVLPLSSCRGLFARLTKKACA